MRRQTSSDVSLTCAARVSRLNVSAQRGSQMMAGSTAQVGQSTRNIADEDWVNGGHGAHAALPTLQTLPCLAPVGPDISGDIGERTVDQFRHQQTAVSDRSR